MSFGDDLTEVGRAEKPREPRDMDMTAIRERLIANGLDAADVDEMIVNTIHVDIVKIDGDRNETPIDVKEAVELVDVGLTAEGLYMAHHGTTRAVDVLDDSDIESVVFAPKLSVEAERAQAFDKVYDMIRDTDVALADFMLKYGKVGRVKALAEILGRARTIAHELNEHYSWD